MRITVVRDSIGYPVYAHLPFIKLQTTAQIKSPFHPTLLFILIILSLPFQKVFAQEAIPVESIKLEKRFKNTVRFNLTNPVILSDKSILIGYERTIGDHQSFSINVGKASFGKFFNPSFDFLDSTRIELLPSTSEKGFCSTVDYRFYLKKENKYLSPRGVYIGPYYSFTYFNRINTWSLNTPHFTGQTQTEYKINIHIVGFQLGYQFIFWDRVALDCILFGPGIGTYKFTASINSELNSKDQSALLQEIQDSMAQRFPGYSNIVNGDEFVKTGNFNTTNIGFRFVIHLGFRF